VGGGIGGLTSAIALGQRGFDVEIIERDPAWSVYGVGIIQQANVIRAMAQLGVVEDYINAGFGFDSVEIYAPDGCRLAAVQTPRLVEAYPANVGIGRKALQTVLSERATSGGARIRLGMTVRSLEDDGESVSVRFSDGGADRYDLLIGADGLNSQIRTILFPEASKPIFENQGVWRYNFPRRADVVCLHAYEGSRGIGLVPLSNDIMYMYLTTPEPGNPRYPREGLAATMRRKLAGAAPRIAALAEGITDDDGVVYKPLESVLLDGPWYKGRCVLIGDAAHATTPHLGQGAGMAIEDSIVLADELARGGTIEDALRGFQARRQDRCRYIVEASRAICRAQVAGQPVDQARATGEIFKKVAEPI
jgi:2-polyprenyl-6-methoxyphenol hydroxylase-like FAD-dependent oxidoreductase